MKKITRQHAIEMYKNLGAMALGYLDEVTLSSVLDNFNKFKSVQEEFQNLSQELSKRLYEGKDEAQKETFFTLVSKLEQETDLTKRLEIEKEMKEHSEFYDLYIKQLKVLSQLFFKEIELDITEVDKEAFIKGVLKGKKDACINEMLIFFAPMFKVEESKENNFSELDELL